MLGRQCIAWALAVALTGAIASCADARDRSGGSHARDGNTSAGNTAADGGGISGSAADQAAVARAEAANRCLGPCTNNEPRPDPLPRPDCPETEPEIGQACDRDELSCGYGDSPSAECRRIYLCKSEWMKAPSLASWPCTEVPADYCPSREPESGSPCELGIVGSPQPCAYGDVKCFCGPFAAPPSIPHRWGCYGPPQNLDCPAELPNVGEGCGHQGTQCNYGVGCYGARENYMLCFDGAWKATGPGACFKSVSH